MHQSSKEKLITGLLIYEHSTYHEALHLGNQSDDMEVSGEFAPVHSKLKPKPIRSYRGHH